VWGLGYTFTSGAQSAWLADEIGEDKLTAAFLRAAQVGTICGLLGVGASALIGTLNVSLPLLLGGAGMLATALFLMLFMPENGFAPTPKIERDTWKDMVMTFRKGTAVVRGSQILMIIFAISLCIGLSSEGLDRFWEAHFIRNFTFPDLWQLDYVIWFGIMNIGTSLITLAVTEFVRRRLDTEDEQKALGALVVIELLMIAGIFSFAWAGNFTVALAAYWATFVFRRTAWPIFDGWLNKQIAPQVRATVLSMHGQMDAIGQILSGPLMGVIATLGSIRIALTAVGGLWLAVIPLLLWGLVLVRRKTRLQVA
jgi:DHA3 family tetracycline resistance protein-like MFS transporter